MPAAVFVTKSKQNFGDHAQDHADRIEIDGDAVTVDVRGQERGRDDHLILDAIASGVDIHVFYRKKPTMGFTYYGIARTSKILNTGRGHTVDIVPLAQRARFIFTCERGSTVFLREKLPGDKGVGCWKRAAFAHVGVPKGNPGPSFHAW